MNDFKKKLCGLNLKSEPQQQSNSNETDDLKVVVELESTSNSLNLIQLYEDLNTDDCSTESIENISKLIAELAKDGGYFFSL